MPAPTDLPAWRPWAWPTPPTPAPSAPARIIKERLARLDKAFVNETEWLVAGFERGRPGAPHPVPWVFHRDGTVQAGDLWKGTWKADGKNAVIVNTGHDECRVVFLSARRFEAFKGGELYRQGSGR